MAIKEKQFLEIEFTGKVKETNEIFDTTNPKDAKALGMKNEVKPLRICVGEGMLPRKFDRHLVGKEVGKEYVLELAPKDAFGERKGDLVKTIPLRIFTEKQVMPHKGMMLNLDGMIVRIASVSGGRVIADFNNPLAGKNIIYTFKVLKVLDEKIDQVKAFLEAFLRLDVSKVKIQITGKKAVVDLEAKEDEMKFLEQIMKTISEKARSILDLDVELKNCQEQKKESKEKK